MAGKRRNFKKKEDPFAILKGIMDEMDFIEEAVPGWELNRELPLKPDIFDRFISGFPHTDLACEAKTIRDIIEMYEGFRKPDEEDMQDALIARERIKMMCLSGCTGLKDIPAAKQQEHYKFIEESLKGALAMNRRALQIAEKYSRQKECRNIEKCVKNYLQAVETELQTIGNAAEEGSKI